MIALAIPFVIGYVIGALSALLLAGLLHALGRSK